MKNGTAIGTNIQYVVEGDRLLIEIDLSEKGAPSKSGKSVIIASSEGNKKVADGRLGLNFYRYADSKPEKKGKKK